MNRLLGQAFAVATFGALATVLTPACADNDQSLFILHAQAPPQNRANGSCVYTPDITQPYWPQGRLDVALADDYRAVLLVGSQLVGRGNSDSARSESNRIHVNGAVVRLTDPNGGTIAEYTTLTSGFVDIQLNNVPSLTSVGTTLIDSPRAAQLRSEIPLLNAGNARAQGDTRPSTRALVANVKLFGTTLGGVDVESGEFSYPIEVCNGCSVAFAPGDDPAVEGVDCTLQAASTAGGAVTIAPPCRQGQDEATSCLECRGSRRACRGPNDPLTLAGFP